MKIKDIMTKEVITVSPREKILKVAKLITDNGLDGIPVVNKKGIVLGIITMTDFFIKGYPDIYLPSYINFIKKTGLQDKINENEKKSAKILLKARAEDIMTKTCVTMTDEMDIDDLLEKYRNSALKTIPIVNSKGICVGVVTRFDILKLIQLH